MTINYFSIMQNGKIIDRAQNIKEAKALAKALAVKTGMPVSAIAHFDMWEDREIEYYPDGTFVKIWEDRMQISLALEKARTELSKLRYKAYKLHGVPVSKYRYFSDLQI